MDNKSQKGVTLTELIVSIAILGIIVVPISLVFTSGYSSFFKESNKMTAQQCAREALYGKGINSYGIMGDLERCDNTLTYVGSNSITIEDTSGSAVYYLDNKKLMYKGSGFTEGKDYFSDSPKVVVDDFEARLYSPGDTFDGSATETTIAAISISLSCGNSGNVNLSSAFRFPKIEK
jgi:prepilin-type N-terminal cleavage/methylation domain-containing protein